MSTFATTSPIVAHVEANSGTIRLIASDRQDTLVDVRPHDASRQADVRSATEARIRYDNGRLSISPAKFGFLGYRMGGVDITIELPSHSRIHAAVASAEVLADGEFAEVKFESASGDLTVEAISGAVKASTASGSVAVGRLKGDLNFQTASGLLSLDRLHGNVKHQAASGSVSIACAQAGHIVAHTSSGEIEIGIPEGTAAQLDVMTRSGVVTNTLPTADGPAEGDETLGVDVRTGSGDVGIHRSTLKADRAN